MSCTSIHPANPKTSREKALQVKNFLHIVDTGGDFWFLNNDKSREDIAKNRRQLARLLKLIRNGGRWRSFEFMEFYIEHFYIPWSHTCRDHDTARIIFNDL